MEETWPVALVTGGARRVGRAVVRRLAEEGFDIALTYHNSGGEAEELAGEVRGMGRRALVVRADLTHPGEAVDEIVGAVGAAFGRLDVLVNNASLYEPSSLEKTELEQMRRLWAIHMEAPLLLCRGFEGMLRRSRGCVVNMVDLLGETPWAEYLAYCASKAGLWNLTLGLAKTLAPEVRVNGIAPGVVEWPGDMPESERERYLKRVPLGRAGTPGDVAEMVVFLCRKAGYVTGQVIRLDGGRSIA